MRSIVLCLVASFILFAAGLAGTYKGTYSGSAGASGDFVVSLTQADSGEWKSEVTFTLGGQDVKTKITSLKVDGSKVTIVYEFDLQGTVLETTITGELIAVAEAHSDPTPFHLGTGGEQAQFSTGFTLLEISNKTDQFYFLVRNDTNRAFLAEQLQSFGKQVVLWADKAREGLAVKTGNQYL